MHSQNDEIGRLKTSETLHCCAYLFATAPCRAGTTDWDREPESVSGRSFSATDAASRQALINVARTRQDRTHSETLKRNMRQCRYKKAQGHCRNIGRRRRRAAATQPNGDASSSFGGVIPSFWVSWQCRKEESYGWGLGQAGDCAPRQYSTNRKTSDTTTIFSAAQVQTLGWVLGTSLHAVAARLVTRASRS